jgi:hypothetical protein
MTCAIEGLTRLMPPPDAPIAAAGDWDYVLRALGTALPADYVDFIARYGTGRIAGFLWVYNPFERNPYLNLLSRSDAVLDADRQTREQFPDYFPEPLFPETGGLLPWAGTDNGDRLYWRTAGEPNSWSVFVRDSRAPEHAIYDLRMSGFLLEWLQGNIKIPVFPKARWQPRFEQHSGAPPDLLT